MKWINGAVLEFRWERLEGDATDDSGFRVERAKVFGGWIVKSLCWHDEQHTQSESMVFIPDEQHLWRTKNDKYVHL